MKSRFSPIVMAGLLCATVCEAQGDPEGLLVQNAFKAWQDVYGHEWQLVFNQIKPQRGRMLLGGEAPGVSPLDDIQAFAQARQYLVEAFDILRVDDSTLVDDRAIVLPFGLTGGTDKLSVRFRQRINNVTVRGASVNVLFDLATGALLSIDSTARPIDLGRNTLPSAQGSSNAAESVAWNAFVDEIGTTPSVDAPVLAIVEQIVGDTSVDRLVWEVGAEGTMPDGTTVARVYTVDAEGEGQGAPVLFTSEDGMFDAFPQELPPTKGKVKANVTADGCCFGPDVSTNRILLPMKFMKVETGAGQTVTSNFNGNFTVPLEPYSPHVTLEFSGPFAKVTSFLGPDLTVDATLSGNSMSTTTIVMNPVPTGAEEVAQANAFHRMNQTRQWVRSVNLLDATADSQSSSAAVPYTATVNFADILSPPGGEGDPFIRPTCRGQYSSRGPSMTFSIGGTRCGEQGCITCTNQAYAPVIWHEMGHWLNDRYGSGNNTQGFAEGNADVFALYQTDYHA
jgi:hypothetical protein